MDGEGNCYEVAALTVILDSHHTLCHGFVIGQGPLEGMKIGHAWTEHVETMGAPERQYEMPMVTDHSNGRSIIVPQPLYYYFGRIDPEEVRRYEPREARALMRQHGHYGPWEEAEVDG